MPEEASGPSPEPTLHPGDEATDHPGPRPLAAPAEARAQDALVMARERRQAILRRRHASRLSGTQQWIFVLVVLVVALAWLFGRDSCTRTISKHTELLPIREMQAPRAAFLTLEMQVGPVRMKTGSGPFSGDLPHKLPLCNL